MVDNHFQRRGADLHPDPKIGRLVLLSLILHLVLVLVFSGGFSHHSPPPKRPVYYIDLTQLPVANPRAGRPDGQSGAPKAVKQNPPAPAPAKKVEAAATVKKAVPPTPAKKAVKPSSPTSKPDKKTATKTVTKPQPAAKTVAAASPTSANSDTNYQTAMSAVDKIRRKQEMAALKDKLAAYASSDSRAGSASAGSSAPLGMADGSGDQAGISQELWLQERLTKNWSLSKYQVVRRDLEARVRISYNAQGTLTGNKFLTPSGDSTFDDSVTRAILKSRQLEFKPGRQLEVVVIFNLKDLMD